MHGARRSVGISLAPDHGSVWSARLPQSDLSTVEVLGARAGLSVIWPGHSKRRRTVCPLTQGRRTAPTCRSHHALARQILRTAFPSLSVRRARSALAFFMSRAGLVHSCSPQFYRHPTTGMAGLRVLCAARAHVRVLLCCALFSLFAFCSGSIHREFCTRINICALCMGWCLHRHTPSMRTDCHMIGRVRFMRQENGCKPQHQFLAFQLNGMLQHDEAHTRRI